MRIDDEIDRLYQRPLEEFTAARNALAKEVRGAEATAVRRLQKPSVTAWAVNQLYWQKRRVYDQLISAADHLRAAHRALLAGKSGDLHKAEAAHRDAVRAATEAVRDILRQAGESYTQATMIAVDETLDALPSTEEAPGRLTRPLKRMGFEALSGVTPRPGAAARKLVLVKPREPKPVLEPELSPAKQREIKELESRLRTAQTEERQLQAEVERGRRELERATREQSRAEEALEEATEKVKRARADLAEREKAHKAASAEQGKLEQRLEKIK